MLRLILGLSGTGKSYTVYNEIKQLAQKGEHCMLLVPEQFSQGAEIRVYRILGDRLSSFVTVCSFSSCAERILKKHGGAAIKTLSDAGRVVYVRRAMDEVLSELSRYGSHRRSPGFCAMCAEAIQELKTAGAQPSALIQAANAAPSGDKLRELALIYSAYNALLENTALDPSDRVALAAEKPIEAELFETHVFVDNFDGFTAPEYLLFEKLFMAKSCTVTLCCESLHDTDGGLSFTSPVKKTAARLRAMAAKKGASVASPVVLSKDMRHKNAPVLKGISEILSGVEQNDNDDKTMPFGEQGEFYVNAYNSRYAEAKAVAAHITRMAAQGVPYGEFAVICRELDNYAQPLKRELSLFNIPFFTDDNKTIETTAPAAFMRSALALSKNGLTSEGVLRLLKSGICGIAENELAVLENYAYTWALKSADWRAPFTKNPSGFGDKTKNDDEALSVAEALRQKIIPRIDKFISECKSADANGISHALYYLMDSFSAGENTLIKANELASGGAEELADGLCRSWDLAMGFLSEMPELLKGCDVNAAEYDELLHLLMKSAKIGSVPQAQDAVLVTTADRMRLESPTCCFVLGVSEGEFPKTVGASGLLTHADRDALVRLGVEMPGGFENRMLLEQMFFYKAFTSSKQALYVSYVPAQFGGGEAAAQLTLLCRGQSPSAAALTDAQLAATPAAALDLLCERGFADTPECAAIVRVLENDSEYGAAVSAMRIWAKAQQFCVSDKAALRRVLKGSLTISPTRVERWHNCRFSYFMEYVLRILPRKKAELSPLESGSLVHYVLENTLREAGQSFLQLSQEQISELSNKFTDEYVAEKMPDSSLRFERIIARIKQKVAELLCFIQTEQQQSSFEPVAFEETIGQDGIEPLTLKTQSGEIIKVVGKIDRVDVMKREGKSYIRVVDYKTGSKKFSLSDVYCGLNMQMLIYLFTLCRNGAEKYPNAYPAGVLYLLADPSPQTLSRSEAQEPLAFETDGLLLDDETVLRAMDKQAQGVFIPVRFNKDGTARKSAKLASLEKLGVIQKHIEELLTQMAAKLYEGDIAAQPLVIKDRRLCDMCDYRPVCRHENGVNEREANYPEKLFEPIGEEELQTNADFAKKDNINQSKEGADI